MAEPVHALPATARGPIMCVHSRVEFVQEPQKADWGTSAIFEDPDGNQFVLSTP